MDSNVLNAPAGQPNELQQLRAEIAGVKQELQGLKTAVQSLQASQRDAQELQRRFRNLADQWKSGRGNSSQASKMASHPAYLEIIGMGMPAVPLILAELERCSDHWFIALRSITGSDPVPTQARGRVVDMAAAWIDWGRRQGIEW